MNASTSHGRVPNPPDWYPDQTGRYELRYWDGSRWTEHVASGGRQGIDPLGTTPGGSPSNTLPSKKERKTIAAQARAVGADDGRVGGGTLLTESVLMVNQKAKRAGKFAEYDIFNRGGQRLGKVREISGVPWWMRSRGRENVDSVREYRLHLVDANGHVIVNITRPLLQLNLHSELFVWGASGNPIGRIRQETHGFQGVVIGITDDPWGEGVPRSMGKAVGGAVRFVTTQSVGKIAGRGIGKVSEWGTRAVTHDTMRGLRKRLESNIPDLDKIGHVRLSIESGGQRIGSVVAEDSREWNFRIQDMQGKEVARVTRTKAGWIQERYTNADNYVLQIHFQLPDPLRSLVIVSPLAIDLALRQRVPDESTR